MQVRLVISTFEEEKNERGYLSETNSHTILNVCIQAEKAQSLALFASQALDLMVDRVCEVVDKAGA